MFGLQTIGFFFHISKVYTENLGEGTLPWPISFFLNEKKIDIFRLMHIALFFKATY